MHHFFVDSSHIEGKRITITGPDAAHIRKVLRMKEGEELSVSNGVDAKEYRCGIERIGEDRIECTLRFIKEDRAELPAKVYLFQGLPKGDKMELIVQKAVELGVYEIIPLALKRCVVKLNEKKAAGRLVRWQGIAEAAAKQSRRQTVPRVREIMTVEEAADYAVSMDVKLLPYELAEGMDRTRELFSGLKPGQRVAVFIGPEGGFEEQEVEVAVKRGFTPITMGKRILRTETAGFTILAWIMYQLEGTDI